MSSPCPSPSEQSIEVRSSGSTGDPKRLQRSLASWKASARVEAELFGIQASGERFAVIGSPDHSLWAYVEFRAAHAQGEFLGLQPGAHSVVALFEALAEFRPSVLYAVPDLLGHLLNGARSRLGDRLYRGVRPCLEARLLLLGGGPWMPSLARAIDDFAPNAKTRLFYGTVEASFVGYSSPDDWPWYRPFPDVAIRVDSKTGQLDVCSPYTHLAQPTPSQNGPWVSTTDCVEIKTTEGSLSFRLIGRMERLLRINGIDVAPEPIEDLILREWPGSLVNVSALIGQDGRSRLGLLYCDSAIEQKDEARIRVLVQERFPGLPVLAVFHRVHAWPWLPSGKTNFRRLEEMARDLADGVEISDSDARQIAG